MGQFNTETVAIIFYQASEYFTKSQSCWAEESEEIREAFRSQATNVFKRLKHYKEPYFTLDYVSTDLKD